MVTCGKACQTDTDCGPGLSCVTGFGTLRSCRNSYCREKPSCLCDEDGGGIFVFATPTPGPGPAGGTRAISVTLGRFTSAEQQTGARPTITGTTEGGAKVTVTIYPDGVGGEVLADGSGKWSFRPTKKLSSGVKNLLVVVTKDNGQGQTSQQFTVVGGGGGISFGTILLVMVIAAVVFGGYVFYKSSQ